MDGGDGPGERAVDGVTPVEKEKNRKKAAQRSICVEKTPRRCRNDDPADGSDMSSGGRHMSGGRGVQASTQEDSALAPLRFMRGNWHGESCRAARC